MSYDNLDLAILKGLISNRKHAIDFVNECDNKYFSSDVWNFANTITNYVKLFHEVPTLNVINEKLTKNGNETFRKQFNDFWSVLDTFQYNEKEFVYNLSKFKNRYAERQLLATKSSLSVLTEGSIDVNKTVQDLERMLRGLKSIDKTKTFENKSVKDFLPEFIDKFNAKKENPEFDRGLMTGYHFIDSSAPLRGSDMLVIAGESGFGKSLLLNNMGIQTWLQTSSIETVDFKKGKNIIYFSLEMPYEDCFNRFLSRLAGVPSKHIEDAKLSKDEFAKIKEALKFIKEFPFTFTIVDLVDPCANDLISIIEQSNEEWDAFYVDYLGIMQPNDKSSNEADWEIQGRIAYELRAIARKFNKPMVSAVQLNRKSPGKDSSENVGLHRLARSSGISTHCSHVVQLVARDNEELLPDLLACLIKVRKGPKTKGKLIKNLACATLLDQNNSSQEIEYQFHDIDDISGNIELLEI